MGGVVKTVGKVTGIKSDPIKTVIDMIPKDKPIEKASQDEMELAARRRGARRRGAMLMSDATLNQANETLGGGNNLG
jgi:hypothetical protein